MIKRKITNLFESEETMENNVEFSDKLNTIETEIENKKIDYNNIINKIISDSVEDDGKISGEFIEFFSDKQFTPEDTTAIENFMGCLKNRQDQFSNDDKLELSTCFLEIQPCDDNLTNDEITNYFFNNNGSSENNVSEVVIPHIMVIKNACDLFNETVGKIDSLAELAYQKDAIINAFNTYIPVRMMIDKMKDMMSESDNPTLTENGMSVSGIQCNGDGLAAPNQKPKKVKPVVVKQDGKTEVINK